MLAMEVIAEIRRRYYVQHEKISSIARSLKLSRQTVRKHLGTEAEPVYQREQQSSRKQGGYIPLLEQWLADDPLWLGRGAA